MKRQAMKRIAVLICIALVISCVSCAAGQGPASQSAAASDISPASSAPPDESGSEAIREHSAEPVSESEPEPEISVPECEKKAEIDSLYGEQVDRSLVRNNVLRGKSYTVDGPVNADYPGNSATLSDGVAPYAFNRYAWIGLERGTTNITFDLGEVTGKIGALRAVCLSQPEYGINLPQPVTVYCSQDGTEYSKLGSLTFLSGARAEVFDYDFELGGYISARYIRFSLSCSSGLVFLGELEAYVYGAERDDSLDLADIYPEYAVPHAEEALRADGDGTVKNLALGAECHLQAYSSIQKKNVTDTGNTQDTSLLCDGEKPLSPAWDAANMFRMTRGDGRDVIFDLGYTAAVKDFAAYSLYKPGWGVYPPDEIGVYVSLNGEEWQCACVMSLPADSADGADKIVEFSASAQESLRARFVKFSFLFKTHTAFTEFEIFGTEKVPETAAYPKSALSAGKMPDAYPASDKLGGAQNVLCSYLCLTRSNCGVYDTMLTADDYLNIIGYYEDGALKDVIFDSMVVTPHNNFAPESDRETLKGWQSFFDTLFTSERGIEAISKAASEIGKVTGDAGYKEKVFLSVIRPKALIDGKTNQFGDIDGDGVNESFDSLENRKKVIRWEVDMQLERLSLANAPNVELIGFYWLSESLYPSEPDEEEIVRYAIDYVHSKGYIIFWIPYYNSTGWSEWSRLGFDFACLQPNYSFTSEDDPDRLYTTALKARLYGMSVEMELADPSADENVKRYKEYIASALEYGYADTVKIYYLGGVPSDLISARDSSNEYERSIYSDTYLYSKRLLDAGSYSVYSGSDIAPPQCEPLNGDMGKRIRGKITVPSASSHTLKITETPRYGALQISTNGSVVYIPEKGFYGEDHFCVAADYMTGTSASARVEVTINYVPGS